MKKTLFSPAVLLMILFSMISVLSAATISGQVTNTTEEPLANCQVYLIPAQGNHNPGQPPVEPAEVSTDETGHYVFENVQQGDFVVRAYMEGYHPGAYINEDNNHLLVIEVDADDAEIGGIDIQLLAHQMPLNATVSGIVTDINNAVVGGMRVGLYDVEEPDHPLHNLGITNPQGEYQLMGVHQGTYKVAAYRLHPFEILGFSAEFTVVQGTTEYTGMNVVVEAPQNLFVSVSGLVLNSDSTAVDFMHVGLMDLEHPNHPLQQIVVTNPQGEYMINHVEPGTYKVAAYRPYPFEILGSSAEFTVTAESDDITGMNIIVNAPQVNTYTLSGTVRDINNVPLNHKFVEIIRIGGNNNHPYMHRHTFTNAEGQYTFPNLTAGSYKIMVRTGYFMPVFYPGTTNFDEAQVVEIVDQNLTDMDITIPNDMFVTLTGSVKDAVTTLPIANAIVSVDLNSVIHGTLPDSVAIPGISAFTNAEGLFSLEVPFGRYRLVAYTPDGTYSTQFYDHKALPFHANRIHAFQDIDSLDFDLNPVEVNPVNSISGTVTIEGQVPDMQVMVVAVSSDEDWEEVVVTNQMGGYTIPIQNPGSYYVIAMAPMAPPTYYSNAFNWENAESVNVEGNISEINFDLTSSCVDGPMNINGQVSKNDGQAAANVTIALRDMEGNLSAFTTTDDNGQYMINNIPSQEYEIIVTTVGVNTIQEMINVTEDASYNYTLSTVTANGDQSTPALNSTKIRNYPNPFNPETTISFTTVKDSKVSVDIYNSKGQKVRTIYSDRLAAGDHKMNWNGRDSNGQTVSSGLYFCRVKGEGFVSTGKMVLMK